MHDSLEQGNSWCAYNPPYLSRMGKVADPTNRAYTPCTLFYYRNAYLHAEYLVIVHNTIRTSMSALKRTKEKKKKKKKAHVRT